MMGAARVAVVLLAVAPLTAFREHPIHAARIELVALANGDVGATVRVYHEDFGPGEEPAGITAYLDRTLIVTDARGARVMLRPTGTGREGERLRISLVGRAPPGLAKGRVQVTILQEKFTDQVNVVDVRVGGRRQQLVFVRGDEAQAVE